MTRAPSPFGDLGPAGPPPSLRSRVLQAARSAVPAPRTGFVDRLWESRSLRLAAAATLLLLVAAHASLERVLPGLAYPAREAAEAAAAVHLDDSGDVPLSTEGRTVAEQAAEILTLLRDEGQPREAGGERRL